MVRGCACGLDIIVRSLLITFSGLLYELNHFLPSIYRQYLMSTTPHTILYQSFWNFAHVFSIVWRCACENSFDPDHAWQNSAWSGSKLFDTLMVFLKDVFEKVNFNKKSTEDKKACKITQHAKSNWSFLGSYGFYCSTSTTGFLIR